MIRVVLDANIYVSALLKPKGLQARILQRGLGGEFQFVLSEAIFKEVCRVLQYDKIAARLPLTNADLKTFLERLIDSAAWTSDEIKVSVCEDPNDDVYLACAKESQADFLVSGDRHLLVLKRFEKAKIITSREFHDHLEGEPRGGTT